MDHPRDFRHHMFAYGWGIGAMFFSKLSNSPWVSRRLPLGENIDRCITCYRHSQKWILLWEIIEIIQVRDCDELAASHLRLFCLPMSSTKDARIILVNNLSDCSQLVYRSKVVVWWHYYFIYIWVGVSCRNSYSLLSTPKSKAHKMSIWDRILAGMRP